MKFLLNRCKRFSYLLDEAEDRPLQASEQLFLDTHRGRCQRCASFESSSLGLNMLRMCAATVEADESFDDRVIRRWQVSRGRSSIAYWSPAFVGAAIAGVAILAALQMIARPQQLPIFNGTGEARKIDANQPLFPDLEFKTVNRRQP